jgi:hypothetical protein
MAGGPSTHEGERTLFEARETIQKLRSQLAYPEREGPGTSNSTSSGPDPATLSTPKKLCAYLEDLSTPELRKLLSRECSRNRKTQNSALIASVYREIKSR